MKKFDVLDIGIIVADIPVKLPCEAIDFASDTFRVEGIDIRAGGDAANSAVALSRLGKKVALAGALGNDAIGNLVREIVADKGVDTDYVRMKDGVTTSTSIVLVNNKGARTFICTRGNNVTLCMADLDFALIPQVRHRHSLLCGRKRGGRHRERGRGARQLRHGLCRGCRIARVY